MSFSEIIWKIPLRIALDALTFYKMVFDGEIKPATGIIKAHWEFFIYLPKWFAKLQNTRKLFAKLPNKYGIMQKSIVAEVMLKGKTKFDELNFKTKSIG